MEGLQGQCWGSAGALRRAMQLHVQSGASPASASKGDELISVSPACRQQHLLALVAHAAVGALADARLVIAVAVLAAPRRALLLDGGPCLRHSDVVVEPQLD